MARKTDITLEHNRDFIRQDCLRDAIIYEVVELEWNMMQEMREAQGKPIDQSEFDSFYQVRYSQHSAMNSDTLGLYRGDLTVATHTGRNFMAEKYDYMKDPTKLPADPMIQDLIRQIVPMMLESQNKFEAEFPNLAGMGRAFDPSENTVPIEVYITSELVFRSDTTLQMILRDIRLNPDYIRDIFEVFVSFFGQDSLQKAEVLAAAQQMKPCRGATL